LELEKWSPTQSNFQLANALSTGKALPTGKKGTRANCINQNPSKNRVSPDMSKTPEQDFRDVVEKHIRIWADATGQLFLASNFSDKNSFGVDQQLTVYGGIPRGLDYVTGKPDAANPSPFKPCTLHVNPFMSTDKNTKWASCRFAWRYVGSACTTAEQLAAAVQSHWICQDAVIPGSGDDEGRILVKVTSIGVKAMSFTRTLSEIDALWNERDTNGTSDLTAAQWYGDGATTMPDEVAQVAPATG
jgi:hypothetical protein